MYCDHCGNKLREGARFCNVCGTSVAELADNENQQNIQFNAVPEVAKPADIGTQTMNYPYQAGVIGQTQEPQPYQQPLQQPVYQQPYQQPVYPTLQQQNPSSDFHPLQRLGKYWKTTVEYLKTDGSGTSKQHEQETKWLCNSCGTENSGKFIYCYKCGAEKKVDNTWVCAKCGASNAESSSICSVCFADKNAAPAKKQAAQNEWKCPECYRVNPGYVTTCTCGCPKSMGVEVLPEPEDPFAHIQPDTNKWKCPNCERINAYYVGICVCGQQKP